MAPQVGISERRIRKKDLLKVFLRSFFIQSVWNFRGLISVGFGVCLLPILDRLYPDKQARKERAEFLQRHLKFFNAHPYMASFALGVTIRLEEEAAAGNPEACQKLERLKDLLITILGALGDQLFWFTIKPASLVVGTLGLLWFTDPLARFWVLVGTFLLYNIPHIYIRYRGIVEGYQRGLEVYQCFHEERFDRLRKAYLWMGIAALVLLIITLVLQFQSEHLMLSQIALGAAIIVLFFDRTTRNFYLSITFTLLFFLMLGFIFF